MYSVLIGCSLIEVFIAKALVKAGKDFGFFSLVSVSMVILQLWSVAITALDSHEAIDMTTFAYVSVLLPVFLTLEPWIMACNLLFGTAVLNAVLYFYNGSVINYGARTVIDSVSILLLSVIAGTFNFYRRIKRLNLETDNEKLTKILEEKAVKDGLTKLYNRHYLTEQLNNPLNTGDTPTGVMMIDIDDFKSINDVYGHYAGDKTLKIVGEKLLDFIGQDDGYAVRFGGEEFLLFYSHITAKQLKEKAESLRKLLQECRIDYDGAEIKLTVSIGLALATTSLSYSGLVSLADNALYKAKEKLYNYVNPFAYII